MSTSIFSRLFASRKSSQRRARNQQVLAARRTRRSFLEALEERRVYAANVFVNDDWFETANGGGAMGTIDNGDTVESNPGETPTQAGLIFGTDAFSSINAAIAAVDVGGTVTVLNGSYNEDVLINKTLTLVGAGPTMGGSTISGPAGGGGSTVSIAASNVEISGFTITRDGNSAAQWNDPTLNSAGLSIQGLAITGAEIHDITFFGNRNGIDVNNSNGHTIRNNVLTSNRTGIIFRNQTDNLTVEENSITGNYTLGILFLDAFNGADPGMTPQQALGSHFNNNNISGNWYGQIVDRQSSAFIPTPGTTNLKDFSGNWFGSDDPTITTANSTEPGYAGLIPMEFGGTAVAPAPQPDIAGPASANFDITPFLNFGTDTDVETTPGNGTFGFQGSFASLTVTSELAQTGTTGRIQEGVNLVTSGGEVKVTAGTFVENVQVTKPVLLSGAQAGVDARTRAVPASDETIVQGPGAVGSRRSPFEIYTAGAGTTIDGFQIENGDSGNFAPTGIWLVAGTSDNTIANNIIQNNTTGIFLSNSSATDQTVIEKNRFSDNALAGPASGQDIYADNSTAGVGGVKNVLIQDNLFTNAAYTLGTWAIGLSNIDATTPFSDISILNNEVENHGRGMYFYGSTDVEITGNEISGAGRYAIGLFAFNGTVNNSSFTIEDNILSNNGKGLYLADDTTQTAYVGPLTISGNAFNTSGTQFSIFNDAVTDIDATDNTFNMVLSSSATTAQQFAIVDTIVDGVDVGGAGFVLTKSGNVYITPNSFSSSPDLFIYGPTTAPAVQRAVDVATEDDDIHIQTGTYDGAIAVNKSLQFFGEPTATLTANLLTSGNLVTITGAGFGGSKIVSFDSLSFLGNGANNVDIGVAVTSSTRINSLSITNSSFEDFDINGLQVFGAVANGGISVASIELEGVTFTDNGYEFAGGAGAVNLFEYNGDASFTDVTIANAIATARGGIQMRGIGTDTAAGSDIVASGTIVLDNVDVTGNFRNYFVTFQRFSDLDATFTDVTLGSATSTLFGAFGAVLRLDAIGAGTIAAPATIDLGNTAFEGLAASSALPYFIEIAPDNGFTFLQADATAATFEGSLASAKTLPELFTLEDRILHYVDANHPVHGTFKGFVEVVDGQAFVSSTNDFTSGLPGVINNAVVVVDPAGTVNIQAGTYTGGVLTSSASVTLSPGEAPAIISTFSIFPVSTGQVDVGGTLVLDANDSLDIELNGTDPLTSYDNFLATGATLGGAKLLLSLPSFTPATGDEFTIISNTGADPVSGILSDETGAPLVEGTAFTADGTRFIITYKGGDGNDVVLTATPNAAPTVTKPLPDVVVNAGAAPRVIDLSDYFSDDFDATLTYTAVSSDGTIVKATVAGDLLTLRFAPRKGGIANVTVTATDSEGAAVSDVFKVTVKLLPQVSVVNGELRIIGTSGNDVVSVAKGRTSATSEIYAVFAYIGDVKTKIFSTTGINSIYVNLFAGNDVIAMNNVAIPTTLLGGTGDDVIVGGLANDLIYGGAGNDVLNGSLGNDIIIAAAGNDTLVGGLGNDVLSGGAGIDVLRGGPGIDISIGGAGADNIVDVVGRDYVIGSSTLNEGKPAKLKAALADWVMGNAAGTAADLGPITPDGADDFFSIDFTDGDIKFE